MHKKPTLQNVDPKTFLKQYWQKKPLLIRQAYPVFKNPLSAKNLMAIAAEENAEARIILEQDGKRPWELRHGPFAKNSFKKLPTSYWTLLVQGTNHWNDELNLLLEDFYFIPQWRIEDVMTSYAVKGGNVGAHVDNYDVFLLQGEGQREWQIGAKPLLQDDFLPEHEVKLLRQFKAAKKIILNPGDMLYLPPHFAHHGIALTDNCITHSIGFRAPSLPEMLDDYLTHVLSLTDEHIRYTDPDLVLQKESGEINNTTLNKIIKLIRHSVDNKQQIKRWFGQYITQNKYTHSIQNTHKITTSELSKRIMAGELLLKNPVSRFSYMVDSNEIYFYANGEEYLLPKNMLSFVQLLTAKTKKWQVELPNAIKHKKFFKLLVELFRAGHFYFAADSQ